MHECRNGRFRCYEKCGKMFFEVTTWEEQSDGYMGDSVDEFPVFLCLMCGYSPISMTNKEDPSEMQILRERILALEAIIRFHRLDDFFPPPLLSDPPAKKVSIIKKDDQDPSLIPIKKEEIKYEGDRSLLLKTMDDFEKDNDIRIQNRENYPHRYLEELKKEDPVTWENWSLGL